jgi:hypothetical protein
MFPTERKDEAQKSLNSISQNCFGLRHENDFLLEEYGFEDADDGRDGEELEHTVNGSFLYQRKLTDMIG